MQVSALVQDTQIRHEVNDALRILIEDELAGRLNDIALDYAVNAFRMALDEHRYVVLEAIPYSTAVAGALSRLQMILKVRGIGLKTELIAGKGNKPKHYELWMIGEKIQRKESYEIDTRAYKAA